MSALGDTDAHVYIGVRSGDLVSERTVAIEIWNAPDPGRAETSAAAALLVGAERDLRYDVDFGVQQLGDIAIRALSPGVNDPTSAETAIGYLGSVFEHWSRASFPARCSATTTLL